MVCASDRSKAHYGAGPRPATDAVRPGEELRGHQLNARHPTSTRALRPFAAMLALAAGLALVAGGCVTVTADRQPARFAAAEPLAGAAADPTAATETPPGEPTETASPGASAAASPEAGVASGAGASSPRPSSDAGVTVGYISLDDSQAFVQAVTASVRAAAGEAGLDLVECDAGWTRVGVRSCATRLAEAGVDGVISFQPFADLAAAVCETVGDVPVVGIVYEQGPCQVSRLEIDQVRSGRLAGAALGELARRRWDCDVQAWVALGSGADDPIGAARMAGFREGYREHCRLPKLRRALADTQHYITAQTRFASLLDEVKGKPIVVAAVSDDAVLGALNAAQQRGRAGDVWAAGQLAQPDVRRQIACDPHFVASVTHLPERIGAQVLPTLADAIDGREVAPLLEAELEVVTSEDVRDRYPDTPACDG